MRISIAGLIWVVLLGWMTYTLVKPSDSTSKSAALESSKASEYTRHITSNNTIAVVDVQGVILSRGAAPSFMQAVASFGTPLREAIEAAADETKVRGILVRLSTPGGTPYGSDEIRRGIAYARSKGKPVYAFVADMSASGGVMAMVAANKIYATRESIVGSIGVRAGSLYQYEHVTSLQDGNSRVTASAITSTPIYRGRGKTLGDPMHPHDPEALRLFNKFIDTSYEEFVNVVVDGRNMTPQAVRDFGARVVLGEEAKMLGLVDEIGTEREARAALSAHAKCPTNGCEFVTLKTRGVKNLLQELLESSYTMFAPHLAHEALARELRASQVLYLHTF